MDLWRYARAGNWPVVAGYAFFTGMMAAGYFYNVTFVQLGLVDLGGRVLRLSRGAVAANMAVLALVTCLAALGSGWVMTRRGWGSNLQRKLQIVFVVVAMQTLLTAVITRVSTPGAFLAWILVCSLTLGLGVPATFGLTTDLIPVRDRGYVAAAITALAYFVAAVFSGDWHVAAFSRQMLLLLLPASLMLGGIVLLAGSGRTFVARWVSELAGNHEQPRFAHGRFVHHDARQTSRAFRTFVVLMFGIFFIDSLGFLRIIESPVLVDGAWQSAALTPRLAIGGAHVLAALLAGVLYTHLRQRYLLFWIFGIFALTHFTYTFRVWLLPETTSLALGVPALYATAVSLYTVLTFAVWADFSTPRNISLRTATGVALSGWAATFSSTALAIQWQSSGLPLEAHLRYVNALAQLFFLLLLFMTRWSERQGSSAHAR